MLVILGCEEHFIQERQGEWDEVEAEEEEEKEDEECSEKKGIRKDEKK